MMDQHKAAEVAKEFAGLTAFRANPEGRGNEKALLEWLDKQDQEGWAVAYATAYVPGQSSTVVWGMMTVQGTWEERKKAENESYWNKVDEGWCYMNGKLVPHAMEWGEEVLKNAYALTYRRQAEGRAEKDRYIELDQRLTIAEGLHWYPELKSWGRWTGETGAVEAFVVEGRYEERAGTTGGVVLVSKEIIASQLHEGGMELVQFIDGTWSTDVIRSNWTTEGEEFVQNEHLAYRRSATHGSWAWVRGVRRVDISGHVEEDVEEASEESKIEFICWPYLPHGDETTPVCRSKATDEALRSYFDPKDERCLQITPVFFRPEVLDKYMCAPERYEVTERSIHAKDAWYLETYDINDAGQVHTYLRYLGYLPLKEQQHWQSCNEKPCGKISDRAYTTDIAGDFGPESATDRLSGFARRQEQKTSKWWSVRNKKALERYLPCTNGDALTLWKESIGLLHQVTVENLTTRYFQGDVAGTGKKATWGTLDWLRHWFHQQKVPQVNRDAVLGPLKELAHLRNTVFAHGRHAGEAAKQVAKAKGYRLRLRGHSLDLTERVVDAMEALERIVDRIQTTPP